MPDNIAAMPRTAKNPEMSAAMVRIKDAAAGPARVKVSVLVAEPLPPFHALGSSPTDATQAAHGAAVDG
jgi:hypothetical protein